MKCSKILATIAFASLFAASSFAADEEIIGKYGAITIKKVKNDAGVERTVAYIDDESKVTPVIKENIEVDSVFFNRKFKQGAASTLMLPAELDASAFSSTGLQVYSFIEVAKDCKTCDFRINCRSQGAGTLKANTPYVVYSDGKDDFQISFHANNGSKIILNTTTNDRVVNHVIDDKEFVDQKYKFSFTGTYESIEFKNPKGIYGFSSVNTSDTKIGDFVQAACEGGQCASVRPFRAYLKATVTSLNKSASDDDVQFPETISVYLIDSGKKGTTYIGQMNTSTGEIVKEDNRWFDMKGRVLDHKPTAKGTYYNNKKKVIIK
jgi:hypothetical protein